MAPIRKTKPASSSTRSPRCSPEDARDRPSSRATPTTACWCSPSGTTRPCPICRPRPSCRCGRWRTWPSGSGEVLTGQGKSRPASGPDPPPTPMPFPTTRPREITGRFSHPPQPLSPQSVSETVAPSDRQSITFCCHGSKRLGSSRLPKPTAAPWSAVPRSISTDCHPLRGRSAASWPTPDPVRSPDSSIDCSRHHATASDRADCGSTSFATPTATAWTTTSITPTPGDTAIGSSRDSTPTGHSTGSWSTRSPATCCPGSPANPSPKRTHG